MSTDSTGSPAGSGTQATGLPEFDFTSELLDYAVTHIFLPAELPGISDYTLKAEVSLARAVSIAIRAYTLHAYGTSEVQWCRIARMLDNLQVSVQSEDLDRECVISQLQGMQTGDILSFLNRPHSSAMVLTKREGCTLVEVSEVPPDQHAVVRTAGTLLCSYPELAIEVPNEISDSEDFALKFAHFICRPNADNWEPSHTDHEEYVTTLHHVLGVPCLTVDVPFIVKHIRDDVRETAYSSWSAWRRSSLWCHIRVTLQLSLDRSPLGRLSYKAFVLFFICAIATDANAATLSDDLLHLMVSKILRRSSKLGPSIPHWLSRITLETCARLREILDARWMQLSNPHASPFQIPSQNDLKRDMELSLPHSREHILSVLRNHGCGSIYATFLPSHRQRGAIHDLLSSNGSFFEEAYKADPEATCYDTEQAIEQNLDDWIACITDVDEACAQLAALMDKYMESANQTTSETESATAMTGIELFVALDQLVVKQVPMLNDYSPEIPLAVLERLLFRKKTSLHRLSRAYRYLSIRHSRARPGWSLFSDNFTEDSFPVRYYDMSRHHQELRACIEQDAVTAEGSQLPLPAEPLHAKVVVFELQCPTYIHLWRSAVARLLEKFYKFSTWMAQEEANLLSSSSVFQRYFVGLPDEPRFHFQIYFAYFNNWQSSSRSYPRLCYVFRQKTALYTSFLVAKDRCLSFNPSYLSYHSACLSCKTLARYVTSTSHTSNDVLAAQADCPMDFSLDEFVAFGQLRSGGSLQWLNILHGLRSKTLNLRRCHVYFLLVYAASQVGPLDLDSGTWIWHKDLQEPSFCHSLLDELQNLFTDAATNMIDGVMMGAISLLLTRMLVSSPSECVSNRAIALLLRVRRKTFDWTQELSYNLAEAPMNEERRNHLLGMAAICRSTFDVDSVILHQLFRSAVDVDAAISCALSLYALRPESTDSAYRQHILQQDRCISFVLEETLRRTILSDVSDYGIDLAVCKIFFSYKPGPGRWGQLQCPNFRWLTCEGSRNTNRPSNIMHLNLLDGELRVDGQVSGGLPREIRDDKECRQIFRDQGFFVASSDLPGMDFTTLTAPLGHRVHFSLRGDGIVVRAQSDLTKDILEWIPSNKLEKDLPQVLVEGHIHWLNLATGIIEIRPLEDVWEESAQNWRIVCASGQYCAQRGEETLIDIQSPTSAMVSQCFKRLRINREPVDVLVSTSIVESTSILRLSATIPHLGLSFFVNDHGELESHDFKDMVYDETQSIGSLYGLKSLLVLRHKSNLQDGIVPRRVLMPNGVPHGHAGRGVVVGTYGYQRVAGHKPPLYHAYDVDTDLGCLIGSGSLASTRFLAYLHAKTTCYRPDPLTGKTGAQAGFSLLQSAGCRSLMKIKALECDEWWTSTEYPQINIFHDEIERRYYWGRSPTTYRRRRLFNVASEKRAAVRAAYLSQWHTADLTSSSGFHEECGHPTTDTPSIPGQRTPSLSPPLPSQNHVPNRKTGWLTTLDQLFTDRRAPTLPRRVTLPRYSHNTSHDIPDLQLLFCPLSANNDNSAFQKEYIAHLHASAQCAGAEHQISHNLLEEDRIVTLQKYYAECRIKYSYALAGIKKALGPTADPFQQALDQVGQWPPVTPDILLRCLASTSTIPLPAEWKKCLVLFALHLLDLQRARRLFRFALDGCEEEFSKELENEGYEGWNPEDYPDWLLIQIQGNFLIRRAQAEIAMEMIAPRTGRSTLMQVNMGEGKSSVIIPIVAAALSDGKQLARVIVPKALSAQMFDLLVNRLGGLANRPIYHLPFFRTPERNKKGKVVSLQLDGLHKIMSQCMSERGILLVQPEHVASIKLMSIETQLRQCNLALNPLPKSQPFDSGHIMKLFSSKLLPEDSFVGNMLRWLGQTRNSPSRGGVAQTDQRDGSDNYADDDGDDGDEDNGASQNDTPDKWLSLRQWTDSHVRDLLDESDEILHPRFQLIYTIGLEQHLDGYPDRWMISQQILQLVKKHIRSSTSHLCSPPWTFPHAPVERASDNATTLISWVVEDVMAGRLPGFSFQDLRPELCGAIRSFISDEDVLQVPGTAKMVEEFARRSYKSHTWNALLLLRGLLALKILWFAIIEKRWRIDYGLISQSQYVECSKTCTMLAVPYKAKDVPAPNTQFGHPDTTIVLTCLSYYHGGLSEEQLRTSFEVLLDEDDPISEYALWVNDYDDNSLPDSLRTLGEFNLRSSAQWDNIIFPLFRRNQAVIDFFLSRVVFPREAKEFPCKISASSWDLVEAGEKVITGFSGTNDGRWLLPLSISQHDLNHQQGTNAKVLSYLMRPENDFYMVFCQDGKKKTTQELLRLIVRQRPVIRVLLDVGAQILDLSNDQVAGTWLDISHDADGAIYFNANDELMVLMRNGTSVPMSSSPLSQQLHRCVVYLDHAHTMGTDLQFPVGARAAVTLGLKLTKDRLVQGCMRMRKLRHGHSVMFFAPPEVDLSIRALACKRNPSIPVNAVDILSWTIQETWIDVRDRAPYWAQQGISHKEKFDTWSRFRDDDLSAQRLSDVWVQPERKSLETLYAPRKDENGSSTQLTLDPGIHQRCKDIGILSLPSAQMDEEQEREVNRQREREREVELPPKAKPAKHVVHQDVVAFVKSGAIPSWPFGCTFRPIFTTLHKTSAAHPRSGIWSPYIFATADFCSTIEPDSTQGTLDQYLRPVQWVLSSQRNRNRVLVLLSPFEADSLMSDIRASEHVHLHLYSPRTSQRMKPSDDLQLYSIPALSPSWTPPWDLIDQLNIFAGQPYLRDFSAYLRLCRLLEVPTNDSDMENKLKAPTSSRADGNNFSDSSLTTTMTLLTIRNRGRPFAHTHMGKIYRGQPLRKIDFNEPCDGTRWDLTSQDIPLSPLDMACDPHNASTSSDSCPSFKRKIARTTEADS